MAEYVELHCHSAYSFLDGASQPEELATRAVELGYEALALTDHDGVYGSLEFAYAAKALGLRSITGAEVTLADGSHVTLLVETPRGYANLCRLLTAAHAHERLNPRLDPTRLAEEGEGLVCLSGCARHGLAVRDPNAAARLARALGRDRFFVELQRPYERGDARRNAALRALAETLGVRTIATGDVHAHHPRRTRLQDVLVAIRNRTSLEGCEPERRGNAESVLLAPREAAARFPDDRGRRPRDRRAGRAAHLRPHARARLPLPGLLGRPDAGRRPARGGLPPRLRGALPPCAAPAPHPRRRAPARGARADRRARALRLLPPPLGGAGAGARRGRRGQRPRLAAPPAAAGARAGKLGRLDRLLPDRALARRPGGRRPRARPLPQPRALLRPRHRPRLPARHPREADRRRHRALRPRALGARGELRHLPRARRDPRRRQGARAPAGGAGAARARLRRLERPQGGGGDGARARRRRPPRLAALAGLPGALRRDRRPAPPPVAAPGRHGHLVAAARRARPGRAGGDGRAPELPVGQGFLRRRRLPQDRPARAGDALRRRGVRRADRAPAREADRPLPHPARRPGRLPGDPGRRHGGPLPDREPRADAEPPAHAPREPRRPDDPGGARAPRADPGQGRAPVHRAAPAPARGPGLRAALRPPVARRAAARDARRDHLPGAGARRGHRPRRLHGGGGRGAAPGDEPQAEPGRDGGLPAPLPRGRAAPTAPTSRPPSSSSRSSPASPPSASPSRTRPPSRSWPTSRPGSATTTRRSSSARS